MKRFTMKRITALVLALVMTLSLLPMTVWAEGEEPSNDNNQSTTQFTGSGMYEEWSGVFIFTELNDGVLSLGSGVTRSGENENFTVTVPCQPDTTKTVYLAVGENDTLTVENGDTTVTCPQVGTWVFDTHTHKVCAVEATDTGSIDSITYTVTRTWNQTKSFTLVFDFSGSGDQGDGPEELMRSGNEVTADDILPTSAMPDNFETAEGFGDVKIPGTENYYMSLIRYNTGEWQTVKIDGLGLSEGMQETKQFAVGFWKRVGQQMILLENDTTKTDDEFDKLLAGFNDTLSIDLKLYTDDTSNSAKIEYPYTSDLALNQPLCAEYVFNHYSQGKWLFVVSGTYNGEYVESMGYTNQEEMYVRGIDANSMTVPQINDALQALITSLGTNANVKVSVELPANNLEGNIVIPACNYEVMLHGKKDSNGKLATILTGGIVANNRFFHAENIRFVGDGTGVTTDNYAISGSASGGFNNCSFTGYHYAVYLTRGIAAGENNFFYNNNVAYRVDDPDVLALGNHEIFNTVFAYNGTDIEIDNADGMNGWRRYYKIWNTIFIGSKQSEECNVYVDPSLQDILFMPKNAFYDVDSEIDKEVPNVKGNVSATPYYTLSTTGKDDLLAISKTDASTAANYLADPTFNDDWLDCSKRFTNSWMCPEDADGDTYFVPGDAIEAGKDMTIDIMGDRGRGHECVATIRLEKKQQGEG